jgi:pyridoxine 4-dehydrogenase
LAEKKGCTPAQLAIGWTKSLSNMPGMPLIIPIPGATVDSRVRENSEEHLLTPDELSLIQTTLAKFTVVGARYPDGVPTDG